ncbi:hypothetical protein HanPI659440_Chr17g0662171 [Helianthus annuus]|nr:hypothetical protein HanPI659440_Chr17g0662171 [Helianthus annuus]
MSATKPHPSLQLSGGGLDSFLPAFTTLNQPYRPYPIVASNTHLETIFAYFFRSTPDVSLRRECLRTKDNGTVSLDWVVGDDYNLPLNSPTLILLVNIHLRARARARLVGSFLSSSSARLLPNI